MKQCSACGRRAYLADVHCQRCGAAIVPPPPRWVVALKRVGFATMLGLFAYNGWHWLTHDPQGRAVVSFGGRAGRYLVANGSDIAGFVFAVVVVPLLAIYGILRGMTDLNDWLGLKVQQWRAERFRRHGW
jgi:hypothetical protein